MTFKALVVEKDAEGTAHAAVKALTEADLPAGEVLVAVEYSTVNYKDGLCLSSGRGLVRTYPYVPGIDFAGTVEASDDPRFAPGDKVVLTGWRVGEAHWGGYSQKARVATDMPMYKLEAMITMATLDDLPRLGREILAGQIKGRTVIDLNA